MAARLGGIKDENHPEVQRWIIHFCFISPRRRAMYEFQHVSKVVYQTADT